MTNRRHYLDKLLDEISFKGRILDIGGKKQNRRGNFNIPSNSKVKNWEFLNLDASTNPDYLMDVSQISSLKSKYDIILINEVFEHINNPSKLLNDAIKLLNPKGILIISMPFLVPLHPDPFDYQRWTSQKFLMEIKKQNLICNYKIRSMGGLFSVIHDLIHHNFYNSKKSKILLFKILIKSILGSLKFAAFVNKEYSQINSSITTGYFVKIELK